MIKPLNKEYLFNFSKIKFNLDFSEIIEELTSLKKELIACGNDFLKKQELYNKEILLYLYLSKDNEVCIFKESDGIKIPKSIILEKIYKINKNSIIVKYLEDIISIFDLTKFLEKELIKIIKEEFIKLELASIFKKDYPNLLLLIFKNQYLINIIDINIFYDLIGYKLFLKTDLDSFEAPILEKIKQQLEIPKYFHESPEDFLILRNQEKDSISKLISISILNKENDILINPLIADYFVVYAIYHKLLSKEDINKLLKKGNYFYVGYILTSMGIPTDKFYLAINKIINAPLILTEELHYLKIPNYSNNNFLKYKLYIYKDIFYNNIDEWLLKFASLISLGNKVYIESVSKENDYFLSRKELIEGLARRIESLSKKLNITPEKLNELIEKNVVSKKEDL